jgi:hypothetical protein
LFPRADYHISGRIEETSAALQVGMPLTQNIENIPLEMHYTKASYKLWQCLKLHINSMSKRLLDSNFRLDTLR